MLIHVKIYFLFFVTTLILKNVNFNLEVIHCIVLLLKCLNYFKVLIEKFMKNTQISVYENSFGIKY